MSRARFLHGPDVFQQEAITCREKGIRIVAPAGSGKTETLARRVAERVESGIAPRRILVLTFDNNARKSLDQYLREFVPRGKMPVVRTLNGYGKDILGQHFPEEEHRIPAEQSDEFRRLRNRFEPQREELPVLEWDGVPRKVLDVFGALKNQGFEPGNPGEAEKQTVWLRREYLRLPNQDESATLDDFWGMPDRAVQTDAYGPQITRILELFAEHEQCLRELGVMNYVDQKSRAFHALWRHKYVRDRLRRSYDEVIVDECQDINRLDAMLVWSLVGEHTTLVLAGDDDQTLYEFRNAHSLYLREPERFFEGRTFATIHLNVNYRSPEAILTPANALIGHNAARIEKSPRSGVTHPGAVTLIAAETTASHDARIAQAIRDALGKRSVSGDPIALRDIAIICHSLPTENAMKATLNGARIPIHKPDARGGAPVENGVEILTWRKAKGRQWKIVILPNSNDRVLPDEKSVREGDVEAVRRLYYVSMTRASEHLVIGYVRADDTDLIHRTQGGEVIGTNGASRFLFEAGLVHPPKEDAPEPPVAAPVPSPAKPEPVGAHASPVVANPTAPTSAPVVTPVVKRAPQPKVEIIVQPVKPVLAPAVTAKPAKPKRATKDWELRQTERNTLSGARANWERDDYATAVTQAWRVIGLVLKRVVKLPAGDRNDQAGRLIELARSRSIIEADWWRRLDRWRELRNKVEHEGYVPVGRDKDLAWELVSLAPDFLAYLAQRVAPKQVDLVAMDDHLYRLTQLVEIIGRGLPHPLTSKPLKALRFDPAREALEVIPLQFLMVLKDVRFFTPEDYRWDRAPILGTFVVDTLGWMPRGMRPTNNHGTARAARDDEGRIYTYLDRLLKLEAGGGDSQAFLNRALEDAVIVRNGNYSAGLKLNPKSLSGTK